GPGARYPGRGPGAHLRSLRPGRQLDQPPAPGNRARAGDGQPDRRAARRVGDGREPARTGEHIQHSPATAGRRRRMRILVAEDNPLNMELVRDLLELDGHSVEAAGDGLKVIELARRLHPDVVLMDVQLPKLDGLAATRRLPVDPDTRAIPENALTASVMPEARDR